MQSMNSRVWRDFIRNTEVADTTNLPCTKDSITRRRNSLFGHVVRLDDHTSAHRALSQVAAIRTGSCPPDWRRRTGRPRNWWLQQIADGTPFGIRAEWTRARRRKHTGTELTCMWLLSYCSEIRIFLIKLHNLTNTTTTTTATSTTTTAAALVA